MNNWCNSSTNVLVSKWQWNGLILVGLGNLPGSSRLILVGLGNLPGSSRLTEFWDPPCESAQRRISAMPHANIIFIIHQTSQEGLCYWQSVPSFTLYYGYLGYWGGWGVKDWRKGGTLCGLRNHRDVSPLQAANPSNIAYYIIHHVAFFKLKKYHT